MIFSSSIDYYGANFPKKSAFRERFMALKSKKGGFFPLMICAFVSLAAGCVNGLLGTGGGILLTYMFAFLSVGDVKDNLANAMAVIITVSAVSLFTYEGGYFSDSTHFFSTAIPAALGGISGAYLSDKVSAKLLNKVFAVLVIYAGINMII